MRVGVCISVLLLRMRVGWCMKVGIGVGIGVQMMHKNW